MRKHKLLTATALSLTLGLVALVGLDGQAFAATTISDAKTAGQKTSTTGDLTVAATGSITVTSGAAITVDSDNSVTLNGKIDMLKSADGATGILIDGGHTGNLTVAGNITVTDDYTQLDPNNDKVLEAPYSDDKTRYGIHSTGTTPFVGNVTLAGATIAVEGEDSYGVRFENKIQGTFSSSATITLDGANGTAISLEDGATGNVYLSGTITARGQNTRAINLEGDFGGNVIIDGTYIGTGYATVQTLTDDVLKSVLATPADLQQSGPLVDISANLSKGLLIGSTVKRDETDAHKANTDQDGDGLVDTTQKTATLTNYGSAPTLRIASATDDITLSGVIYNSNALNPPTVNYGLLIRGAITGFGVYQTVDNVTVQLGGLGHDVNIANGIGIQGAITSNAYGGNATAFSLQSGTITPLLDITGTIRATSGSATTKNTATDGTVTYTTIGNKTALAIDIREGASLPVINIIGGATVVASGEGSTQNAIAIRDQSNTLTTINNKNIIVATISASDDNRDGTADTLVNRGIAIDTRSNTVGLTLIQTDTAPTDSDADKLIPAPYILGDILLGSGNDTITINGGKIDGNLALGAGNDTFSVNDALILGDVNFGAGMDSFILDGDSTYVGKMTNTGQVNLDIKEGNFGLLVGTQVNLSQFHVGEDALLGIVLDVDHPTTPIFINSGAAVFDDGAEVNLNLNKIIFAPVSFTLMTASSIDLGDLTTRTTGVPYIYHADLVTNSANTMLSANFRLKTQAEAQYSDNQYAAFVPVLSAVRNDAGIADNILRQTTKAGFDQVYNQYLPDYSGENLLGLSLGSASLNRTLGSLTLVPDNEEGQWWLQQYGYQTQRKYGETAGFKSTGFSFAGGREREFYGNQMVGIYLLYTSATPLDNFALAQERMVNNDVTVGGYWRLRTGGLKTWLHAGAGYTSFESIRNILTSYQNQPYSHVSKAKWSGFSYSGGLGASYEIKAGNLGFTPQLLADYYALNENDHSETGGGDYFDLTIGERDSHLLTTSALLNVNYSRFFIKPEIWVGYRQNVSAEIADTVANFKGATPFTLSAGNIEGGGPVAGFRLSADNQYSYFSLEGEYEKKENYSNYSLSLRTRFQF